MRCLNALADGLNEVCPLHFFHTNNHLPHIPAAAGMVDTFPVVALAHHPDLYAGLENFGGFFEPDFEPCFRAHKYKGYRYKFQICINNLGMITQMSGPYLGSESAQAFFQKNRTFSGRRGAWTPPPRAGGGAHRGCTQGWVLDPPGGGAGRGAPGPPREAPNFYLQILKKNISELRNPREGLPKIVCPSGS